jgi:hypothetical protein
VGMPLVVASKSPVAADPGERPFNNPTLREHHKAVPVAAAHDLERPPARPGHDGLHLAALIARIPDDALDEGKGSSCLPQQGLSPVSILHAGGVDGDGQEQPERVGQDVTLATGDLLARIIAGRVERGPPLTAPLVVWLSRMAVVGLASRPAISRVSTYRA